MALDAALPASSGANEGLQLAATLARQGPAGATAGSRRARVPPGEQEGLPATAVPSGPGSEP
eukprot:9496539-Lingulodinium_polyedra.AAC.1